MRSGKPASPFPDTPFWNAYRGRFSGILTWPDFDALWEKLANAPGGWFVFDPEGAAPDAALGDEAFQDVLKEARALVEQRRASEGHCGAVYVDNREAPSFVKVFDPLHMGSSCSIGTAPILPRMIFSHMRPDPLPAEPAVPEGKGGLLQRLMRR